MTAEFSIDPRPHGLHLQAVSERPVPEVTPLDLLSLAVLYHTDPELALELAAASAAQTKKEPTK